MSAESMEVQKKKQRDDLLRSTLSSMAASTSKPQTKKLADTIEDNFLLCKICNETFKNPKCLNCLHSFCEQCLEKHFMQAEQQSRYKFTSSDYRDIQCPLCRKRTSLPLGGIKKLPDNFIVNGLTDVIIKQKPAGNIQCDVCALSKKASGDLSCFRCMECCKHLCKDCAAFHKSTKVTKHHSLFDLKLQKEVQCSEHQDEVVRFYCETCQECVCVVCTFQNHQGHDVTSFEDAIAKFEEPIRTLADQCHSKLLASENTLDKLERCENLIRCVEQCVKDKVTEMMTDLKIREKQVLEDVRNIYGEELLKRIGQKKEFVIQIENMKNTSKLAEVVLESKSIEFLLLKKTIESKLSSIASLDEKLHRLPPTIDKLIEFRPSAFSFGYIYDYDDPDPGKEPEKNENTWKKLSSDSIVTSNVRYVEPKEGKKDGKKDSGKKEIVADFVEKTKGDSLNKLSTIGTQTMPLSLDCMIEAYKQERRYSPAKDLFYSIPNSSTNQTPLSVSHSTKSSSLAPSMPQTAPKNNKFVLPEIPSFRALKTKKNFDGADVSKEIEKPLLAKNDKTSAFLDIQKNYEANLTNTNTLNNGLNIKASEQNALKDSIVKDAAIILKQPFPKLDRVVVSPPPQVISFPTNTNSSFDLEKSTTDSKKIQKVVATVAPNVCSVARATFQTSPLVSQVSSKNLSTSILRSSTNTKSETQAINGNTSKTLEKTELDKISDSSKSSTASKNDDFLLRKKLRDRDLTHLSDSPLFRQPRPSQSNTSISNLLKDRKSPGKFSNNPALQLYYQTIGSRQNSPYSSKPSSKTPYSPQTNRISDGYKYTPYKFH